MAFARFDTRNAVAPMAEINMVPLIDVMLVLLVIFIVTAPLLTHAVKIELPQISSQADPAVPDQIDFSIDSAGQLSWNGEAVSRAVAAERFNAAAQRSPQPELRLHADQAVAYRVIAQTLGDASNAGLRKVGFVSAPERLSPAR